MGHPILCGGASDEQRLFTPHSGYLWLLHKDPKLVEADQSRTIPYTISEKSGFSYGDGWGGIAGGLTVIIHEGNLTV